MNAAKLLDRLKAAVAQRNDAEAAWQEHKTSVLAAHKAYRQAVAAVEEIQTEILTGQPARPLLEAVEERQTPTSPKDYFGHATKRPDPDDVTATPAVNENSFRRQNAEAILREVAENGRLPPPPRELISDIVAAARQSGDVRAAEAKTHVPTSSADRQPVRRHAETTITAADSKVGRTVTADGTGFTTPDVLTKPADPAAPWWKRYERGAGTLQGKRAEPFGVNLDDLPTDIDRELFLGLAMNRFFEERFTPLIKNGATDHQIDAAIRQHGEGGISPGNQDSRPGHEIRWRKNGPIKFWLRYGRAPLGTKKGEPPDLVGQAVIDRVRSILSIPEPAAGGGISRVPPASSRTATKETKERNPWTVRKIVKAIKTIEGPDGDGSKMVVCTKCWIARFKHVEQCRGCGATERLPIRDLEPVDGMPVRAWPSFDKPVTFKTSSTVDVPASSRTAAATAASLAARLKTRENNARAAAIAGNAVGIPIEPDRHEKPKRPPRRQPGTYSTLLTPLGKPTFVDGRVVAVPMPGSAWDEADLLNAAEDLRIAREDVVLCNRCNRARAVATHPCPGCRGTSTRFPDAIHIPSKRDAKRKGVSRVRAPIV